MAYIADMMEFWDVEFWDEKNISGRREEAALARGRADTARNLLRMGLAPSQISEATGLSLDEIKALRDGQS